jgi:RNA polymerase sigma-70 factor (ECF subfamily)
VAAKRDWIDGISAGRQDVFLSFYERISVSFLKFIYFRANGDMELAEEVFQEALTRLVRGRESLRRLQDDDMLFPWLCGVARRILADRFRERSGRKVLSLESLDAVIQEAILHAESRLVSDEEADHPQMRQLIGMVMSALHPTHAETLKAKYCDGLSVEEIARKFGETVKAIDGRLYRAREAFRSVFQQVRRELETRGGA